MSVPGLTPDGHVIPLHIAVLNHSNKISDEDVAFHVEAVRLQMLEHIAPAWDQKPPGLMYYGHADYLRTDQAAILAYVNDDGNADSAGYHTEIGGLVYGLVDVHQSRIPSVTLSHEAGEMYANARLNRMVPGPKNRRYYVELMDPVQRQTYKITVTLFGETRQVDVADFVYPSWFGLQNPDGSTKRSHTDQELDPFEVAPGGYQIALEDDGEVVFLSTGDFAMRQSKHSRTSRIIQGYAKPDPKPGTKPDLQA